MTEQKAIVDSEQIKKLIKHRYPFLLIDRVDDWEVNTWLKARKNVTVNEPHFSGHFPEVAIMPGVLVIEAFAQATLLLIVLSNDDLRNCLGFLVGISSAKFRRTVVPGDVLMIEVKVLRYRTKHVRLECVAKVDGQVVCSAIITAALAS